MKMRTIVLLSVLFTVAVVAASQDSIKLSKAQKAWLEARFDCTPMAGLMTSWMGQLGKKDFQDKSAIVGGSLLLCRAQAAAGDPACAVTFQHSPAIVIPTRNAVHAPAGDDVITLTCNGTNPTCCQLQVVPVKK